ncbi:hypothetical protein KKE14_01025 [Patescibacteria group bacterium]|nr:hypothetical protein [Patescibacteria group bacterium]
MPQIIWRIIAVTILILMLFLGGCVRKKMLVAGPSCPNEPGIAYIRFGDGPWQKAQNLPWIRLNAFSIDPEFPISSGINEGDLLHGGTLPSPTSIEIAIYFNPSEWKISKYLKSDFAKGMELYGLKVGGTKFLNSKAWFRDNQCFATVHDKCTKEYIWLRIDQIPCNSKYQVLYAPGIGAADFLVFK